VFQSTVVDSAARVGLRKGWRKSGVDFRFGLALSLTYMSYTLIKKNTFKHYRHIKVHPTILAPRLLLAEPSIVQF
jgi:hypothetical protein